MEEEVPRASTPDMNSGGNQPHTSLESVAPAAVVVVDGASQDPEILARGARASADDAEEQSPRGDVDAPSDGLDVQQDQNDPGVGDAADPLIHTSAPSTGPASARIRLDASLSESAIGSDVSTVVAPKPGVQVNQIFRMRTRIRWLRRRAMCKESQKTREVTKFQHCLVL